MKRFAQSRSTRSLAILACVFITGLAAYTSSSLLAQGSTPSLVYTQFDPLVVRSDRTDAVNFYAKIIGNPSRVILAFDQPVGAAELELRDDGMGNDLRSRDGIYSASIPALQLTRGLQPDDVFKYFVGFLKVFQGSTRVTQGNIFAEIITTDFPVEPVISRAPDVQYTANLVNIVDPSFFADSGFNIAHLTKQFYQLFGDDYDFIDIVIDPSYFQNRFHFTVKNNIQGIGVQLSDRTGDFGSSGKLLGITVFPNTTFFDGVSQGYQHELGHQWINYLSGTALASGIPHWPLSSLASGIMGWSVPPTGEGGDFPCNLVQGSDGIRLVRRTETPVFTDLDLYLMGLLEPNEVRTQYVFPSQDINTFNTIISQCNGQIYQGKLNKVTLDDVVHIVGPRNPTVENSPHQFKIATILVTPDKLLDADAMAYYNWFAMRAELSERAAVHEGFSKENGNPFFISTKGLGTLDARIQPKP
ncbi:hypothetical protein HY229_08390 [Candidatus Acetothermia bacterium]|nr:hypothetical protein [Candidatus Acetothermia bacterium]MBI3644100.1 hypothetical protein [Candidatus Acetothermia bacterium]